MGRSQLPIQPSRSEYTRPKYVLVRAGGAAAEKELRPDFAECTSFPGCRAREVMVPEGNPMG